MVSKISQAVFLENMILLCLLYVMFKSSFKVPRSFSQASCGGGGGVHSLLNLSSNVDSHVPAC